MQPASCCHPRWRWSDDRPDCSERSRRGTPRAARAHGRSAEAEVREILSAALVPSQRLLLGDALASLGRDLALTDDDVTTLDSVRDRTPAEPLTLP
ncbi:FitA-like ribbon-helix-helix domain-containing protein [Microbacterium sp.]|uniref:FitA-like ribbon-helix-helix domain-containing protein n=1 Tax=Microbacterium sp. TaxID=51671 RepID=UPI003A848056